jgi:hypothetical protein
MYLAFSWSRWFDGGNSALPRHINRLVASRTIDGRSTITGVALDVLAAARAEEFEFSHDELVPTDYVTHEPAVY